jgi:hypothetical protein
VNNAKPHNKQRNVFLTAFKLSHIAKNQSVQGQTNDERASERKTSRNSQDREGNFRVRKQKTRKRKIKLKNFDEQMTRKNIIVHFICLSIVVYTENIFGREFNSGDGQSLRGEGKKLQQ